MKNVLYKPIKLIIPLLAIVIQIFSSCDSRVRTSSSPDTYIDNLVLGKLAYDFRDTMKVGITERATVTITKSLNDSILFLGIDSSGFVKEEILVSSKVAATLIDPSSNKNFAIQSLNSEEQFVDSKSNTMWLWNVTPLRSGQNDLILRVSVNLLSDLGEASKDIPVFEKKITVHASTLHIAKQFFGDNWQWIAGTIIIPLIIWRFQKKVKVSE